MQNEKLTLTEEWDKTFPKSDKVNYRKITFHNDDMQEVYKLLKDAEMLVIASPIYYHGISGQLKCVIDRFYSAAYPTKPPRLKKVAMILSSGDANMYDGALFSFKGDFLDYLGLENMGVFTAHGAENGSASKLNELKAFGKSLA